MGEGILIAFDGIDGAGKTTQVGLVANALTQAGETVIRSKEPTDGQYGRQLRASATSGRLSVEEELRLFVADRQEHVATVIKPALDRGEVVILDRYYYSTVAYQGSRGADVAATLAEMRQIAPTPDVTYLVDLPPALALDRIQTNRGDSPNHFERHDSLVDVRAIFQKLAATEREIVVIDGAQRIENVYAEVIRSLILGALKTKRCFKSYDCDMLYCSARLSNSCRWAEIRSELLSAGMARS